MICTHTNAPNHPPMHAHTRLVVLSLLGLVIVLPSPLPLTPTIPNNPDLTQAQTQFEPNLKTKLDLWNKSLKFLGPAQTSSHPKNVLTLQVEWTVQHSMLQVQEHVHPLPHTHAQTHGCSENVNTLACTRNGFVHLCVRVRTYSHKRQTYSHSGDTPGGKLQLDTCSVFDW